MSAFYKDIFREIKYSVGRFISLLIITMLGTASVVGIHASSIDMRDIADKEYKNRNVYDLQLKSNVGFNSDDIAAIQASPGVASVMPTHMYDAFMYLGSDAAAVRTYALPDTLNTLRLLEGRLPETVYECAIDYKILLDGTYKLGDTITLEADNMADYSNMLGNNGFTIVGAVSSPLYVSDMRGNTTIGNGTLRCYIYLHPETYVPEIYTDVYILMEDSRGMYQLSGEYDEAAKEWKRQITQTCDMRVAALTDELDDAKAELNDGWDEYYSGIDELNEQLAVLEDGKTQADNIRAELEENLSQLELIAPRGVSPELDAQYAQLDSAFETLEKTQSELDEGFSALDNARKELDNARQELEDAQETLEAIPQPEWFVLTRIDGVDFDSYYQDTLRLQKIGYVFPMVFFLVAILVSLTSMTRMVDEHRTQIGIYKALGYRPAAIMAKYLVYAFSASITGGVAGVFVGSTLFPRIITDAYGHLYNMPPVETPIPLVAGLAAVFAAVASVVFVTLFISASSMSGVPAELMRPKSPPIGKRVFLERIPFFWSRLSFIGKVTARNIFRYKRRFIMTLIGVAGCSALLVTAFGLRDSIRGVTELQYGGIVLYDARAYLKEIKDPAQRDGLDAVLPDRHLYIHEEAVDAGSSGLSASLIVPENSGELSSYIALNLMEGSNSLASGSVLLTDKLARVCGVSVGGNLTIKTGDGSEYVIRVTGIVDNYVQHFIYMPPDTYCELFDNEFHPNSVLAFTDGEPFAAAALENENVRAVAYTYDIRTHLSDSTDALGIVTIVLIILACALAFVVLFNLTNINISERIRELATIKVLGFQDEETAMYIYRENGWVTAMGIALGIAAGILLHKFVLVSVEIDLLKFPHIIRPLSYLLAVLLSLIFAVFVNLVMNFKLAKIDMVESLKKVE